MRKATPKPPDYRVIATDPVALVRSALEEQIQRYTLERAALLEWYHAQGAKRRATAAAVDLLRAAIRARSTDQMVAAFTKFDAADALVEPTRPPPRTEKLPEIVALLEKVRRMERNSLPRTAVI